MANREEIIARIKSLRAKADCEGATEAEAMEAAAMAAKLLMKYDITPSELADVRKAGGKVEGYRQGKNLHPVLANCGIAISKFTETRCYQMEGELRFIGIESDVLMAIYLSELVVGAAKRIWRDYHPEIAHLPFKQQMLKRESLYIGFGVRISQRLMELHQERVNARGVAHGTALVVVKTDVIRKTMEEHGISLKRSRAKNKSAADGEAFMRGHAAAAEVSLDRPFGAAARTAGAIH